MKRLIIPITLAILLLLAGIALAQSGDEGPQPAPISGATPTAGPSIAPSPGPVESPETGGEADRPQAPAQLDPAWWTLDGGGWTFSSGGAYTLGATIGQPDAWGMAGGDYALMGGFWGGYVPPTYQAYLPVLLRKHPYLPGPDLVVDDILVSQYGVQVVIANQGDEAVPGWFWVDLYISPNPPPSRVNQTWEQIADYGIVWGVPQGAVYLNPGVSFTLTISDSYYWPERSSFPWPLPIGAPVYVQVDSANAQTTYGGVLENHEMVGGAYNNVSGPEYVYEGTTTASPPAAGERPPHSPDSLPPRPQDDLPDID